MTKRTYILLFISLILFGFLAIDQLLIQSEGKSETSAYFTLSKKKSDLQRYSLAKDQIKKAYSTLASPYIDYMGRLAGFKILDKSDEEFIKNIIKSKLDQIGGIENLIISIGSIEKLDDGIRKGVAEVSFATTSNHAAIDAIMALGLPQQGFSWNELSLIADNESQEIKISGRLEALIIESVE